MARPLLHVQAHGTMRRAGKVPVSVVVKNTHARQKDRPAFGLDNPRASEAQIHAAVISHWRALGFPGTLVATIPNMAAHGQSGLTKGLPDLLIIGPGGFVAGLELKKVGGKPSQEQAAMQSLWRSCGHRYEITYGRDEPIALLTAWGICRAALL